VESVHEQGPVGSVSSSGQYLSFRVGMDDYAVDILRVQEIRGWEQVRALPDSPDFVKGVLDMRGIIVPIIDLRMRFGNPRPSYSATTVVIVVSVDRDAGDRQLIGAVVDSVSDVLELNSDDLRPPPVLDGAANRQYLDGMVSRDRGIVVLLDLNRLFGSVDLGGADDTPP
jgi:purine-binding chemotaxis protein CheW